MKTTIDLPEDLVRQLKFRAVREGRKLKDVAADIIKSGLTIDTSKGPRKSPRFIRNKKTGLLMIDTEGTPAPGQPSSEQMWDILHAQEAGWIHDAS